MKTSIFFIAVAFATISFSCESKSQGITKNNVSVPVIKEMDESFPEILLGTIYFGDKTKGDRPTVYYDFKNKGNLMSVILSPSFSIKTNSSDASSIKAMIGIVIIAKEIMDSYGFNFYADDHGDIHTTPFFIKENPVDVATLMLNALQVGTKCEITKGYGWSQEEPCCGGLMLRGNF